jgi:hypothetical protein
LGDSFPPPGDEGEYEDKSFIAKAEVDGLLSAMTELSDTVVSEVT